MVASIFEETSHTLYMLIHSPSTPMTISVRFLFLIPLMLHTPVAWMRPFVELTGFDSEAKVKGAPISLSDDIAFARPIVCRLRSAGVVTASAPANPKVRESFGWGRFSVGCAVA